MTRADPQHRDDVLTAERAFVFAYPLVAAGLAAERGRLNELTVARTRPDSLHICGWLDAGEPLVLTTPNTEGRYFVLWLRDAWNAVFASVGARTTGIGARAFAVLAPDRHGTRLPPGLTAIASPTRLVNVRGCLEALVGTREPSTDGFGVVPLSAWPQVAPAPRPAAPADGRPPPELGAREFFSTFWRHVRDNPADGPDREPLERLRAIAPPAGWEALAPSARARLEAGVQRGYAAVRREAARPAGTPVAGWRLGYETGRYGSDYAGRAAAAYAASGAEPAADELVAVLEADDRGEPLSGEARYLLRFAADAAPPVTGFWSLIARDRAQPAHEGGVLSDLHGLRTDTDGSLPVLVQRRPPARRHRSNWLPAPAGAFRLELRLYWPHEHVLAGGWSPPAVRRLGRSLDRGDGHP